MTTLQNSGPRMSLAEVLLYALILALPFEHLVTIAGGSIIKWIGLLFFAGSLLELGTFYKSWPLVFLCYFVYAGIGIIVDFLRTPFSFTLVNESMRPVLLGVLMVAAYNLAANRGLRRPILALAASAILFSIFQISGLAGDLAESTTSVVEGESFERISALATDPNFSACFMSLALIPGILALSGLLPLNRWYLGLSFCGALGAVGGILKTGSRGALIALSMGVLSTLFVARTFAIRIVVSIVAALVLGLVVYETLQDPLFRARLQATIEDRDTATRLEIWGNAITLAKERPLFGFGYTSYTFDLGKLGSSVQRATHNIFLSVFVGSGAFGFVAFLCFYWDAVHKIWRCRKSGLGMVLFPWFVIAFAGSLTLNLETTKWYWLIAALALAAPIYCERELGIPMESVAARRPPARRALGSVSEKEHGLRRVRRPRKDTRA